MITDEQNIRLIFGLKLKQLRKEKGLSFSQLSKASGMSVSYLNEIEKGKKYPKTNKIISLAEALNVEYDELVSLKLGNQLAPVAELLNSKLLTKLPFKMFGLETSKVIELIARAPVKVNAFISTLIKLARTYEMRQEDFYFSALRSYQEMHENYFEDLEIAVEKFVKKHKIDITPPIDPNVLYNILIEQFGYTIDRETLEKEADLRGFRSVFVEKEQKLCINPKLAQTQVAFLLGKEIAFNALKLKDRPKTSNLFEVNSFEEVLSNFKASYFSVALLMNEMQVLQDLRTFFSESEWSSEQFLEMMKKYAASPEMFLHRLSNLLPRHFGLQNLFFLRLNNRSDSELFHISKELHLSRLHNPHGNELNEHYCRRWVSVRILQELKEHDTRDASHLLLDIQRSQYINTENEYLCISIARPNSPTPHMNVSVTIGLEMSAAMKRKVRFWNDEAIPIKQVNETCQRCPLQDCQDRAADPSIIQSNNRQAEIKASLERVMKG